MYADTITPSMQSAIDETERRRDIQQQFNTEHGIVPKTVFKSVRDVIEISHEASKLPESSRRKLLKAAKRDEIAKLEKGMMEAAKMLDFEYAAVLRDRIKQLRSELK
jgi:excinuclease ABC subunit B